MVDDRGSTREFYFMGDAHQLQQLQACIQKLTTEVAQLGATMTTWQQVRCQEHHEQIEDLNERVGTLEGNAANFGGRVQGVTIVLLLLFNLATLGFTAYQAFKPEPAGRPAVEATHGQDDGQPLEAGVRVPLRVRGG